MSRPRRPRTPAPAALPIVLVPHPHVRTSPSMLGGSPYVEGSRVPVRRLFAFYRSGASVETLLRRYPSLGPAKILDALAFAFDNEEVIDADLDREAALMTQAGVQNRGPRDSRQIELPFAAEDDPMPARGSAGPRRRRGT